MDIPKAFEIPIYVKRGNTFKEVIGYKAIVGIDGTIYDVVTEKYKLVQHEDVVKTVNEILEKLGVNTIKKEINIYERGARMFYNVFIRDVKINGDTIYTGFRVTNSYDRTIGLNVYGYGLRILCSNQMVFDNVIVGYGLKHLTSQIDDSLDSFKKRVKVVIERLDKIEYILRDSTTKTIKVKDVIEFINRELKVCKTIRNMILAKMRIYAGKVVNEDDEITLYQAYQSITDALTHNARRLNEIKVHELIRKSAKILTEV